MGTPASASETRMAPALRVLHLGRVLGIGQKREVLGPGVLHAGHAGDFQFPVAFQAAPQPIGNFAKFHNPVTSRPPAYQAVAQAICAGFFQIGQRPAAAAAHCFGVQ